MESRNTFFTPFLAHSSFKQSANCTHQQLLQTQAKTALLHRFKKLATALQAHSAHSITGRRKIDDHWSRPIARHATWTLRRWCHWELGARHPGPSLRRAIHCHCSKTGTGRCSCRLLRLLRCIGDQVQQLQSNQRKIHTIPGHAFHLAARKCSERWPKRKAFSMNLMEHRESLGHKVFLRNQWTSSTEVVNEPMGHQAWHHV